VVPWHESGKEMMKVKTVMPFLMRHWKAVMLTPFGFDRYQAEPKVLDISTVKKRYEISIRFYS